MNLRIEAVVIILSLLLLPVWKGRRKKDCARMVTVLAKHMAAIFVKKNYTLLHLNKNTKEGDRLDEEDIFERSCNQGKRFPLPSILN